MGVLDKFLDIMKLSDDDDYEDDDFFDDDYEFDNDDYDFDEDDYQEEVKEKRPSAAKNAKHEQQHTETNI